ncbi:MAG: AAA family ATPase [Planctomycetota bacterium]
MDDERSGRIADAASAYHGNGLAVLPAKLPDKRPAIGAWKNYQSRLPTAVEIQAWFANSHDGCCLICGAVSGNLELIDFDCAGEAFAAWSELVTAEAPGLLDRLTVETSPSGGWHVVYRSEEPIAGNLKLAQRREDVYGPLEVERFGKKLKPRKDKQGRWHIILTMIETRGEGGLFLCAPTPGYELVQGGFADLPVLTADERDVLLRCARALHEVLPEPVAGQPVSDPYKLDRQLSGNPGALRPGDLFAQQGDLPALLECHGWSLVRDGENQHWCRPGKTGSTSATLRDGVFYVFSSNATPFESEQAYSPFAVYAQLEHGGDFQAAATELRRLGFGEERPSIGDDVDLSGLLGQSEERRWLFDHEEFEDMPDEDIDWLWPGVMPRGMLSLIGGKQGLGKSFLICDLAARISAGLPLPDGTRREPGRVLLLAREDHPRCVLKPRLKAAGANLGRITFSLFANAVTFSSMDLASQIEGLIDFIQHRGYDLVVIDTFAAFASAGTDANAAQDVRLLLDSLTRVARETNAAVVVVAHLRKTGQGDGDPMDAIAGSAQMTAGVRVASMLDKGIGDGERWFRVVKSNLGQINEEGWTWRFAWPDPFTEGASDMPHIVWSGAGQEYQAKARGQAEPTIDAALVREHLHEVLAQGPRSQRSACDLIVKALRKARNPARKIDIEIAFEDIIDAEDGSLETWDGPRNAKMVGLSGSRPSDDQSPQEKALKAALENPEQTVRALREQVGCRREIAQEALRIARGQA